METIAVVTTTALLGTTKPELRVNRMGSDCSDQSDHHNSVARPVELHDEKVQHCSPIRCCFLPIILKTMTPIMTSMIHDDGMMRMTMTKAARMIMMIIIVMMVAMMNGDTGDVVVDGSDDEDGDGDVVHAVCWSCLR